MRRLPVSFPLSFCLFAAAHPFGTGWTVFGPVGLRHKCSVTLGAAFRRTLEENEVLDTFDRYVFESIVEKVIVGGYDEDGNKDPAMLTFIYKTGFKNSLDGTNFKPPRKNSKAAKQNAGLCSHTTDEAKSMCSYHSDDTRGDSMPVKSKMKFSKV